MNWIYSIGFDLQNLARLAQGESAVARLDKQVQTYRDHHGKLRDEFGKFVAEGNIGYSSLAASASRWVSAAAIGYTTISSLKEAARFDAQNIAIDFATGGDGAKNIQFIKELSDRLGLSLQASREGFKQFAAATRDTPLQGQATRDIYEGVAMAGGAMRLSAEQLNGAYLALGQIQSKGRVQAEELRGQLGERIPGAFKIAADAMGVTQAELNKMLETGQVASEDFLPRFGAQLKKVFQEDAMAVAQGPAAAMDRFTNSVYDLQIAFGTYLLPTVTVLLSEYLIPSVTYLGQHIDMFAQMAIVVGTAWVALKAYSLYMAFAATATHGATIATWLWNLAWAANPVGRVIMAVSALVGTIIWAWHTFEGFRGFLYGMWSVVKEFASLIMDYMIRPLMSFGKTLIGVFTFNTDLIKEGIQDGVNAVRRLSGDVGFSQRISDAFSQGHQKGLANFRAEQNAKAGSDAVTNSFGGGGAGSYPGGGAPDTPEGNKPIAGLSGITGRGQTKNITINLGSLVQDLRIAVSDLDMGVDEIQERVERALLQVLNSANTAQ